MGSQSVKNLGRRRGKTGKNIGRDPGYTAESRWRSALR